MILLIFGKKSFYCFLFFALFFLSVLHSGKVFSEDQGPPGGISLTNTNKSQPADTFKEKITIINNSTFLIKKVICTAVGTGNKKSSTEFGPINPQSKKTSSFSAWHKGTFAVELEYEIEGKTIKSRPFTSVLDKPIPVPTIELTFGNSRRRKGGIWKNIAWKMDSDK